MSNIRQSALSSYSFSGLVQRGKQSSTAPHWSNQSVQIHRISVIRGLSQNSHSAHGTLRGPIASPIAVALKVLSQFSVQRRQIGFLLRDGKRLSILLVQIAERNPRAFANEERNLIQLDVNADCLAAVVDLLAMPRVAPSRPCGKVHFLFVIVAVRSRGSFTRPAEVS